MKNLKTVLLIVAIVGVSIDPCAGKPKSKKIYLRKWSQGIYTEWTIEKLRSVTGAVILPLEWEVTREGKSGLLEVINHLHQFVGDRLSKEVEYNLRGAGWNTLRLSGKHLDENRVSNQLAELSDTILQRYYNSAYSRNNRRRINIRDYRVKELRDVFPLSRGTVVVYVRYRGEISRWHDDHSYLDINIIDPVEGQVLYFCAVREANLRPLDPQFTLLSKSNLLHIVESGFRELLEIIDEDTNEKNTKK